MADKVNMETLLKQIPDRYKVVSIAAQRARALNLGEKPLVDSKFKNNALIALEEIVSGAVKMELKPRSRSEEKEGKK